MYLQVIMLFKCLRVSWFMFICCLVVYLSCLRVLYWAYLSIIVCLVVLALVGSASAAVPWGSGVDIVITDYQDAGAAYPGVAPYEFGTLTIENGGTLTFSSGLYSGYNAGQDVTVNAGGQLHLTVQATVGYNFFG